MCAWSMSQYKFCSRGGDSDILESNFIITHVSERCESQNGLESQAGGDRQHNTDLSNGTCQSNARSSGKIHQSIGIYGQQEGGIIYYSFKYQILKISPSRPPRARPALIRQAISITIPTTPNALAIYSPPTGRCERLQMALVIGLY